MEQVNVNNIELAFDRLGQGTPLVLIHGFPLDHRIWDQMVPYLKNEFDLITPDLRGFGESSIDDHQITMDSYAADIAALLDQLSIQKAVIAGHSMGGYVALAFAKRYPERLLGLALFGSQAVADNADRKEGRYKTAAEVAEKGIGDLVEAMAPKFSSDENIQGTVSQIMEQQAPAAYIGALRAMAERLDSTELLRSFQFPVVIVHGDADALIPIDRAREIKEILSKAHYLEIPSGGHVPMLEFPVETAKALENIV